MTNSKLEQAVEAINEMVMTTPLDDIPDTGDIYETAQQILALCEPEWIPVDEQSMPDMFMQVLVAQHTGAVFIATFEAVDGWYSANNLPIEDPTHWKPLPEPPEQPNE